MKNLWVLGVFTAFLLISCKNVDQNKTGGTSEIGADEQVYTSFGEKITAQNSISAAEMEERYENLQIGDTLEVNFRTNVNAVCKNKGCWMQVNLPEQEDVMVKFKDYGFFVPKDIEEKEVILNGKAYVTEVSVEEQRHYAEDNGQTPEEVAAITKPKKTLSFLADGVLIKK